MNAPTAEEVLRTAAIQDPVLRNLSITLGYHRLSAAMARVHLGRLNWCTFATWASRQAGRTIRGEDLRAGLEAALDQAGLRTALEQVGFALRESGIDRKLNTVRTAVLQAVDYDAAVGRAAGAVARGNLKVFEEIAYLFAGFLTVLETADEAAMERFRGTLRPGDPPEGQALLRQAFDAYLRAAAAESPSRAAQETLLANLLIGYHEQMRLQPEIREAMDAALGDREAFRKRLLQRLLPGAWLRLRVRVGRMLGRRLPLDVAVDRLFDEIGQHMRIFMTSRLMTLGIPGDVVIRLGADIGRAIPDVLRRVDLAELSALLERIDRAARETGERRDWSDFNYRIHLIATFFRAHHDDETLHDAPFTGEHAAMILAGRMPSPVIGL
jgi:hypothetical protein